MKLHELKIKHEYFEEVDRGRKTFELRKNDRNYQVGDLIHFVEVYDTTKCVDYAKNRITTKQVTREFEENPNNLFEITYILKNVEEYGLDKDYCILAIKKLEKGKRIFFLD